MNMTGQGKQFFRNLDQFNNSKYKTHEGSIVKNCLDGEGILYYGKSNQIYQKGIWKMDKFIKPINNIKIIEECTKVREYSNSIQHNLSKWNEKLKEQQESKWIIEQGIKQYNFYNEGFHQQQGSQQEYHQHWMEVQESFRNELQRIKANSCILQLAQNFQQSQQQQYFKEILEVDKILELPNYQDNLINWEKNANLVQIFSLINAQIKYFQDYLHLTPKKSKIYLVTSDESYVTLKLRDIEYFRKKYNNQSQMEKLENIFDKMQNEERKLLISIQDKFDQNIKDLYELNNSYYERSLRDLNKSIEENEIRQSLEQSNLHDNSQIQVETNNKQMELHQKNKDIIDKQSDQLKEFFMKAKEESNHNKIKIKEQKQQQEQEQQQQQEQEQEIIQKPSQIQIHQSGDTHSQQNPSKIQLICQVHANEKILKILDDDSKEIELYCQKCLQLKYPKQTLKIEDFMERLKKNRENLEKELTTKQQVIEKLYQTCIDQLTKSKEQNKDYFTQIRQNNPLIRDFDKIYYSEDLSYNQFKEAISSMKASTKINQSIEVKLQDNIKVLNEIIESNDLKLKNKKQECKMKILNEETHKTENEQQYWCKYDQVLQKSETYRLNNNKWLTSSIVDAYMNRLNIMNEENYWKNLVYQTGSSYKRCLILPSHIFTGYDSNPESNIKIQEYLMEYQSINYQIFNVFQIICCVVNINKNHWVLARLDFDNSIIFMYDSMNSSIYYQNISHKINKFLKALNYYKEFKIVKQKDVPQQNNSYDCGVYTCIFAQQISQGQMKDEYLSTKKMREILNETIKYEI